MGIQSMEAEMAKSQDMYLFKEVGGIQTKKVELLPIVKGDKSKENIGHQLIYEDLISEDQGSESLKT